MDGAAVVVMGRALFRRNDTHNMDLLFQVDCVLKSAEEVEANITIDGRFFYNSCTTTYVHMQRDYIFALEKKMENGAYNVYEANIASTAAYELPKNQGRVDVLMEVCGFQDARAPTGGHEGHTAKCPAAKVEKCRPAALKNDQTPTDGASARVGSVLATVLGVIMAAML
jgi:hypothetical protein